MGIMRLKNLITSCLLLVCTLCFGQTWENMGTPSLQRRLTSTGYEYRFNAGSKGFYSPLPSGLQGQILRVTADNSTVSTAQEPSLYGQFIYTDAQLTRALAAGQATQLQIFNSFFRYSHGGDPSDPSGQQPNNTIPGQPLQTNSWAYDTVTSRVTSTFNSGSAIGLVSTNKYDVYTHSATLGASGTDNDRIGLEIAFAETGTVANNAYGLSPGDFNWPIDVVHTTVPNQHSLTVFRNREGSTMSYFVVYDYQKLTQKVIANGSALAGLYNTNVNWPGVTVDMRVVRTRDTIICYTSQYSDAPGGKGSLAFPLIINLNSDTVLTKFKGKQAYGYVAQSQAGAFFSNISFSGDANNIYDLRNGAVYNYNGTSYVINPAQSILGLLGTRFWWRNTTEQTYGYMPPTNLYDVIVEPSAHTNLYGQASLNFPSTGAAAQSTLTISVPGAVVGSPVTVGVPLSIVTGNYQFNGVVSASGVVSVVYQNLSGGTVDPSIGLFKVTVFQ